MLSAMPRSMECYFLFLWALEWKNWFSINPGILSPTTRKESLACFVFGLKHVPSLSFRIYEYSEGIQPLLLHRGCLIVSPHPGEPSCLAINTQKPVVDRLLSGQPAKSASENAKNFVNSLGLKVRPREPSLQMLSDALELGKEALIELDPGFDSRPGLPIFFSWSNGISSALVAREKASDKENRYAPATFRGPVRPVSTEGRKSFLDVRVYRVSVSELKGVDHTFGELLDLFRLFWLTPFQSIRQDLKGKVLIPGMTRKMKRGQALQSSAMGSSFPYGRAVWLACDEEELR
ncbi:hypothetical protein V6N12_075895 [Hibiscus sabdariffa]